MAQRFHTCTNLYLMSITQTLSTALTLCAESGRTVSGGEMYVDCKYNKQELYKSHWDIHTSEDGTGSQVLFFPLQPGKLNIIKDLDIPYFLPKVLKWAHAILRNPPAAVDSIRINQQLMLTVSR